LPSTFSLSLCGDNHYPPFEFLNDEGAFKGFNIDILEAIGTELGIKVEFQPMPWAKAVKALEEGQHDAIQGMVMSPKRRSVFVFSEEYLVVSHAIFVLQKRYDIMGMNDLKRSKVAIQRADVSYELINSQVGNSNSFLHFVFTNNQVEAFEKLIEGKVDAYIGNRLTGMYLAQKLGELDRIRTVGEPISPTAYCIAVLKDKQQLLEQLNRGIRAIKNNGIYDSICEKWFGTVIDNLDKQIVESVDVGVVAVNHLGVVVSINSYARKVLGLKKQSCFGRHLLETSLAEYFDPMLIYKAMTTGKGFFDQDVSVSGEIGPKTFTYNVCPLFEEKAEPIGCVISFRDISTEKQMRESLIRKDKMESLGLLLANLVHEIKNPITSIKTFVEALSSHYDDPKFRLELSKHLPAEVDRLTDLINNVLEYSKQQRHSPGSIRENFGVP
jgi:PAS domain S-box-containing protein